MTSFIESLKYEPEPSFSCTNPNPWPLIEAGSFRILRGHMEGSKRNRGRDLAFSKHQQWYEIFIPQMGKMRPGEDMAVSSNTQRALT